jgi:hypothetical protein
VGGFDIVTNTANSKHSRVTAALRSENVNARTPYSSCGVTFVSPHYAVTAGHCFPGDLAFGEEVLVEQIRTNGLELRDSMTIEGNWPNWTPASHLTEEDNYFVTELPCRYVADCRDENETCSSELLNMFSLSRIDNQEANNFHYTYRHQLLPLHSVEHLTGGAYRNVVFEGDTSAYHASTLAACHGTSGSGVFQADPEPILLGPVVYGNAQDRLCNDMRDADSRVGYVKASATAAFLAAHPQVAEDRQ